MYFRWSVQQPVAADYWYGKKGIQGAEGYGQVFSISAERSGAQQ